MLTQMLRIVFSDFNRTQKIQASEHERPFKKKKYQLEGLNRPKRLELHIYDNSLG